MGKTSNARQAYRRLLLIRADHPWELGLVHAMAALLFSVEQKVTEAEAENVEFIRATEESGHGRSADVAAALSSLASLYIVDGRVDEARRALDQAGTILESAVDVVVIDRVNLLLTRGIVAFKTGNWEKAESYFHESLSLADGSAGQSDAGSIDKLLPYYAKVLRKLHRRDEARAVEARASALAGGLERSEVVDVTELSNEGKRKKKSYKP